MGHIQCACFTRMGHIQWPHFKWDKFNAHILLEWGIFNAHILIEWGIFNAHILLEWDIFNAQILKPNWRALCSAMDSRVPQDSHTDADPPFSRV